MVFLPPLPQFLSYAMRASYSFLAPLAVLFEPTCHLAPLIGFLRLHDRARHAVLRLMPCCTRYKTRGSTSPASAAPTCSRCSTNSLPIASHSSFAGSATSA